MEENNEQNQNAGDPPAGDPVTPDPGTPGDDPVVSDPEPGTPSDSGSPDPDLRDEEITNLKRDNKALNRAVITAKRSGRSAQGKEPQYSDEVLSTPEGQYAVQLEVADGRLRKGLEERLALYPEIGDEVKARIRKNPWAFVDSQYWRTGDYESALDEIELELLERADKLEADAKAKKADTTPDPQGSPEGQPANVQGNPAPETVVSTGAPGSTEDTDPWTMPLDKLEGLAKEKLAKMKAAQTK